MRPAACKLAVERRSESLVFVRLTTAAVRACFEIQKNSHKKAQKAQKSVPASLDKWHSLGFIGCFLFCDFCASLWPFQNTL
jgi:hypothetical protein